MIYGMKLYIGSSWPYTVSPYHEGYVIRLELSSHSFGLSLWYGHHTHIGVMELVEKNTALALLCFWQHHVKSYSMSFLLLLSSV